MSDSQADVVENNNYLRLFLEVEVIKNLQECDYSAVYCQAKNYKWKLRNLIHGNYVSENIISINWFKARFKEERTSREAAKNATASWQGYGVHVVYELYRF